MIPEFILTLANASSAPSTIGSRATSCKAGQVVIQETRILDYTKKPPFPEKSRRRQVWGCLTLGQPPHMVLVQTIETTTK